MPSCERSFVRACVRQDTFDVCTKVNFVRMRNADGERETEAVVSQPPLFPQSSTPSSHWSPRASPQQAVEAANRSGRMAQVFAREHLSGAALDPILLCHGCTHDPWRCPPPSPWLLPRHEHPDSSDEATTIGSMMLLLSAVGVGRCLSHDWGACADKRPGMGLGNPR